MEKQIKIALAGNPNCGKTTLFNALTGSNQFVGNWPGVTVEKKEGKLKKHDDVAIMDLPGIYSLSPYTLEEVVARNYLITERPDAILNIIDGTNLERNLYLTTQLTELGIPVVIAINMMDVVRKNGDQINVAELSRELGCKVMEITFPDYESDSSALVKMYLSGRFGDKPDDVNPYAASSFYAVDRYASYKTKWGSFYEAGGIVIADRYTTSNAVHQCSKLPPEQWNDFLRWAFDYEYRLLGLPAPDAVVYLQVDPAVSQKLMTGRYHGDESRKDVHEKDIEYLARSRRAAEYCAEHLGWATVHCTENGAMRTIEDIQAEVRALAEKELG